ncbi:hypothetical protein MNBD_DELTA02-193 [hydrothermal vent metagenome]|uniref:Uncharacterized protein n=1 Tax=hydrothermal vent metagenome TaxID=652676 RepID=A0A3B0VN96_9ZZZZ
MAFWDRVSEELKRAATEGWEAVKAGTKVAAEKSEEVAKTGKLRYRSHTVHKKADKLFGQLGGIVYDMAEPPFENPLLRADVQRLIEDIKQAELEATAIDEEVERVKKSASSDASDVPYYYEAKSENRAEGSVNEEEDAEGGRAGAGSEGSSEGSNESEHACYSDCSGPCQCADDTIVNSDLPKDGGVEKHVYKCPTGEPATDEEPSEGTAGSGDEGEGCESKGGDTDASPAETAGSTNESSADEEPKKGSSGSGGKADDDEKEESEG